MYSIGYGLPCSSKSDRLYTGKAHALVRADGLGILLVYRYFPSTVSFHGLLNQGFSDALPPFVRRDEEHFDTTAIQSQEGRHGLLLVASHD